MQYFLKGIGGVARHISLINGYRIVGRKKTRTFIYDCPKSGQNNGIYNKNKYLLNHHSRRLSSAAAFFIENESDGDLKS